VRGSDLIREKGRVLLRPRYGATRCARIGAPGKGYDRGGAPTPSSEFNKKENRRGFFWSENEVWGVVPTIIGIRGLPKVSNVPALFRHALCTSTLAPTWRFPYHTRDSCEPRGPISAHYDQGSRPLLIQGKSVWRFYF
jgi:hypothetical protein